MEYIDNIAPRERKTRRDVLTPFEASMAKKTSKTHKLKPRVAPRDRTKTVEMKRACKQRAFDRVAKGV